MLPLFILLLAAGGDAAKGKDLFQTCAGCHNTDNDQRKMGPSLRSLFGKVTLRNGRHADDENVREIVLDGYNGMPSFRYSFRPAEIDDLMAYLHTLTGKPAAPALSTGEAVFRAYCIRCHATDLRGKFKPEAIKAIDEGHAGAPAMNDWLDPASRSALLEFLKTFSAQ
ncbi:MAG: c-type cytochrome [Acidobacteriota bacterium]|nr:c-type cytochrome [Acidobacteriota bacterium]